MKEVAQEIVIRVAVSVTAMVAIGFTMGYLERRRAEKRNAR